MSHGKEMLKKRGRRNETLSEPTDFIETATPPTSTVPVTVAGVSIVSIRTGVGDKLSSSSSVAAKGNYLMTRGSSALWGYGDGRVVMSRQKVQSIYPVSQTVCHPHCWMAATISFLSCYTTLKLLWANACHHHRLAAAAE